MADASKVKILKGTELFGTQTGKPGNSVTFSQCYSTDFAGAIEGYSIKLAVKGSERYLINQNEHIVPEMDLLTALGAGSSRGAFSSGSLVTGLCIDISKEYIQNALADLTGEFLPEDNKHNLSFLEEIIVEKVTPLASNPLQADISLLLEKLKESDNQDLPLPADFYLQAAALAAQFELTNIKHLLGLKRKKLSAKKELFRRVLKGKLIIESSTGTTINFAQVAGQCYLSEFTFFHAFKQAFGLAPYRYFIQLTMRRAEELLCQSRYSITEIAEILGFSDLFAFSKAFKKETGLSPAEFKKSRN